jgi:hypothetical protein
MPAPPLQNFIDLVGPVMKAAWLNAVDAVSTTIFEQTTTKAAARTALTNDAAFEIANGGTGARTATAALAGLGGVAATPAAIGTVLFPQTAAEAAGGISTPSLQYQGLEVINVLRYGIVPNNPAAATANTTALISLLNPNNTGPTGRLIFPNTTGADIYYFNNVVQVRDGIRMDLMGSTLNFSKAFNAADNTFGFFTFIRDVSIENGSIVINYTGTGGVNAGMAMRIGGRDSYGFAQFPTGVLDQDSLIANGLPPMGNIILRNLRITSNNATANANAILLMLGGVRNFLMENIVFTGIGAAGPNCGLYYEFGAATKNGFPSTPAKWSSSHAHGLVFRNIWGFNLSTSITSDAYVISLVEAYSAVVENIFSYNCQGPFEFRIGEAHFFRPWAQDLTGVKRGITVRNLVSQGASNTAPAAVLNGSQPSTAGYLSDANMIAAGLPVLTPAQKVDLMRFSLDGFSLDGALTIDGPCDIRNGAINGNGTITNPLYLQAECQSFHITNVDVLNGAGPGIRANDISTYFPRTRIGTIRNCKVAGNTGAGITLAGCESVLVENCQLGYNALYDAGNEATQTSGIQVDGTVGGGGVHAKECFVTTSGGAVAYAIIGSVTQLTVCCNIVAPKGTVSSSGPWDYDDVGICAVGTVGPTAGSKNSYINNNGGLTAVAITFTAAPTGTSATLNAAWAGATGQWPVTFSDAEVRYANFVNGATTCTWTPALTGAPTTAANVNTCGSNKYQGKMVYDTTNLRLLIATGPQCTDNWEICNATGGTVTPS